MNALPYSVQFSHRKTISLSLNANGTISVRAPWGTAPETIETIIERHRTWIERRAAAIKISCERFPPFKMQTGSKFTFFGQTLTLILTDCAALAQVNDRLCCPISADVNDLIAWIKRASLPRLEERVRHYAAQMGVRVSKVSVTSAKTRWGSCAARSRLNFTFRLAFCPPEVIDYVVVHELAHIPYPNHQADFWQLVKTVLPSYTIHRQWLKENAGLMNILP